MPVVIYQLVVMAMVKGGTERATERANNQMGAADGYRRGKVGRCSNQYPRIFSAPKSLSAGVTRDRKSRITSHRLFI